MDTAAEFVTFTDYFGPLAQVRDRLPDGSERVSTVYGFENVTIEHRAATDVHLPETDGTFYGFVSKGTVGIWHRDSNRPTYVDAGEYFAVNAPLSLRLDPAILSRIVLVHSSPFTALTTVGGPIEPKGRLRYIDRCSDTLLIAPPRLGDPCLNLLHFPPGIHQTAHTHPSIRCGMIASGAGYCINGDGERRDLVEGMVWIIPAETVHSFHTAETNANLNVIAYHPDSDFGPQDEDHPMLNRTWVDGAPIDNTTAAHANPDVMEF